MDLASLPKALNRIMVFGLPGSGKSTFASQLAHYLDLPIYHLDKYFFAENWRERDYQEFLNLQQDFVDEPKWVIDGNAMKSLEMRFQKADIAIYFHYPIFVCLWRTLKRAFQKNWHLPDLAGGCTKSVRFKLIKYLFLYHKRYSPKMNELRQSYPQVAFYAFKSDDEATTFLNSVNKGEMRVKFGDVLVKKSKIGQFEEGLGVFANREFKKGERVLNWNLKVLTQKEYNQLVEHEKKFCHFREGICYCYPVPERYVNRSKNPNVFPDFEKQADVALRDIKKGEEFSILDTTEEDF